MLFTMEFIISSLQLITLATDIVVKTLVGLGQPSFNMESLISVLTSVFLPIHVVAGFSALISFWIPTLTRKGKRAHRLSGKIYVFLMWIVVLSAAALCLLKVAKGEYLGAAFLGFLSLITAQPLWYGIAVLRYKRELPRRVLLMRKVLSGLVSASALAMLITAAYLRLQGPAILLLIFGLLGIGSIKDVIKPMATLRAAAHWITDHLDGMIVSGIAAHTAFFAFGGNQFFTGLFVGPWVAIPWSLPTVIGIIAMRRMKRRYPRPASTAS
jgi:uncharacterized membrane protein